MPIPTLGDQKRESELYARVVAARRAYDQAKDAAAELEMLRADLGLNHPDGRASALKAARSERYALEAYGEALREFTVFVLEKKPPRRLSTVR